MTRRFLSGKQIKHFCSFEAAFKREFGEKYIIMGYVEGRDLIGLGLQTSSPL